MTLGLSVCDILNGVTLNHLIPFGALAVLAMDGILNDIVKNGLMSVSGDVLQARDITKSFSYMARYLGITLNIRRYMLVNIPSPNGFIPSSFIIASLNHLMVL